MGSVWKCSVFVLWGSLCINVSMTSPDAQVSGRTSRQAPEREYLEGVWGPWSEWTDCSETCGLGVSERRRLCLPPPHSSQPWDLPVYLPPGLPNHTPVISAIRPFYPSQYSAPDTFSYGAAGEQPPFYPQGGFPVYRGPHRVPVPDQPGPGVPLYREDFPPRSQDPRSAYSASSSLSYGQLVRPPRQHSTQGTVGGTGIRRSVTARQDALPSRRSPSSATSIRPGQFGYGRVPFSLPLHRQNRHTRHTVPGGNSSITDLGLKSKGGQKQERLKHRGSADGVRRERDVLVEKTEERGGTPVSPEETLIFTDPQPPRPALRTPIIHTERERVTHPRRGPNTSLWHLQSSTGEGARESQGPSHSYRCSGPDKQHRKCSSQSCPGSPGDARAEQCSSFNQQEFMGRLYDWEPFTEVGLEKQCELTCRPAGFRFYVRQANTVRDGTPCTNSTSSDVCVGGRCLTEGCDAILGSGLVRDRCGICGGQDASCRRVSGSFLNSSAPLGYHRILDIPPGATAINITERKASSNYLALRSGTGQSVVNGRWAVDPPGEYKAGGTTFTYTRPRVSSEGQEEAGGETLTAPGPTTTLLQLYIIHHKENPGIDYEFYVPVEKEAERGGAREKEGERAPLRELSVLTVTAEHPAPAVPIPPPERPRPRGQGPNRNARIPPRTDLPLDTQPVFAWQRGGLSECSASCGKGSHYRVVYCVNRHTEQEVPERRCDSTTKPDVEEEPCNVHPCPPFWEAGPWSECSVSCGPGLQQRQLQCRQSFGNRSTMVHPQRCANLQRPDATQPCQLHICSHWEIRTNWSSCSVDCGVGKRMRTVRCVSDRGNVVNDRECNARLRPQGSEDCHMGPCVTNWYFTDWTQTCSAQCGPGVQRREVVCLSSRGASEEGGEDCVGEKPADMKACNGGPCVAASLWYAGPWGQCSSPCGTGNRRRDIICVEKLGSEYSVVPAGQCAHLEKPSPVQACEVQPCQPQWFTTQWSACSRSCGNGLQTREVRCLTADKKPSPGCELDTKPQDEQLCNTLPCSPIMADENCRDRRHNCMMVVQARLCVYSYYKTACCASCSQNAQRAKRQ